MKSGKRIGGEIEGKEKVIMTREVANKREDKEKTLKLKRELDDEREKEEKS